MSDYYDKGWEQFPFDINLYNWAIRGRQIASEKIHLLKEYKMKKKEIKKLNNSEINKNIEKLKKDLFNFRFQKINGQIKSPSKLNETKKSIARLKTMLGNTKNA